jgi:hypothetical protein
MYTREEVISRKQKIASFSVEGYMRGKNIPFGMAKRIIASKWRHT